MQSIEPPILIYPEDGAEVDNGCTDGRDSIVDDFDWSDVNGATKYELYRKHAGSMPSYTETNSSFYYYVCDGCYVIEANRFNWKWKVRAFVNNIWTDWSEERSYDFEPLNTDCPTTATISTTSK